MDPEGWLPEWPAGRLSHPFRPVYDGRSPAVAGSKPWHEPCLPARGEQEA